MYFRYFKLKCHKIILKMNLPSTGVAKEKRSRTTECISAIFFPD
jgi:hypothetical protein